MKKSIVALAGVLLLVGLCGLPARAASDKPPEIAATDVGARIEKVSIETYGVTNAPLAMRYLTLREGGVVTRSGVLHDYIDLAKLAGLRTRLAIRHDGASGAVTLHWIVLGPTFAVTDHPFYGDPPLEVPIEGFGTVLTSHPLDEGGGNLSLTTQVALRAQLARLSFTQPLWVNRENGREGDLVVSTYGARGVYRESQPVTGDVYSWVQADEALYLVRGIDGTQVEAGLRTARATSAKSSYITAPSIVETYDHAVRSTALEAAISHTCPIAPTHWYPPYCYVQYRFEGLDSIGGLGANTEYHFISADVAQYTRIGSSTIAVHGAANRSGGVLPASFLLCAYTFGYPTATCGTDTNLVQGEFRLADARPGPLKFILFTETASSRIRGGTQAFTPPTFQWRADSGVGLQYRGFRFNVASGSDGGRITYEVQGQLF